MLITEKGRLFITRLFQGARGEIYGAIGTGTREPSIEDTSLQQEVYREKVYDILYYNKAIIFTFYLPRDQCVGELLSEIALVGKIQDIEYLICRGLINPPIEKTDDLALLFQIAFYILNEEEEER